MKWVLFAFTAPWSVITWAVGGLSMVVWLAHKPKFEGAGILTLEWREWFASGEDRKGWWKYSTTLGRVIWFQPGARDAGNSEAEQLDERLERHERVHIRQVEDRMLLSFIVGLIVGIGFWAHGHVGAGFAWWLLMWASGGLWQLPNFLTAMMRFGWKGVYRDTEHERSAYAQTHPVAFMADESWWDMRERQREEQKEAF